MDNLIQIEDLHKEYRIGKNVVIPALNGINFSVSQGEFLAVNGHSGSGKSTLLNILGLLDGPTRGKIAINGHDIRKFSEREKINFRLHSIGFVFQFFNLIENYTALENITFQLKLQRFSNAESKKRADEVIKFLGLAHRASFFPNELSGGEQQRIAIGRALAKDSLLILVDEPTAHLDLENSRMVMDLLRNVNQKFRRTIIMVTHEDEEAKMADRIITMSDGKVIGDQINVFDRSKPVMR